MLAAVRVTLVLLAAIALILSSIAAVAPNLHADLHADAHHNGGPSADHQCAAVSFAKGSVESAEVMPAQSAFYLAFTEPSPLLHRILLPVEEYRLLPGRAPPLAR